ncbi:hypothetical protein CVT24_006596 [Panaeolus cyanescens]|uniref:Retrotransposon gag domain-containing protein n=1 Tax=Panaeolus cyanescens TaxID=181874 RepID=A0A409X1B1_9AGAR|nr:hypothetical protein CVT24_006596 [Panaeolus cyanescens]
MDPSRPPASRSPPRTPTYPSPRDEGGTYAPEPAGRKLHEEQAGYIDQLGVEPGIGDYKGTRNDRTSANESHNETETGGEGQEANLAFSIHEDSLQLRAAVERDLSVRLAPIWVLNGVKSQDRQQEILAHAVKMVQEAIEQQEEDEGSDYEEYANAIVHTAQVMAKRYKAVKRNAGRGDNNQRPHTAMSQVLYTTKPTSVTSVRNNTEPDVQSTRSGGLKSSEFFSNIGNKPNVTTRVPRANTWKDRVAMQKMRDEDLRLMGHSMYDDQGIIFQGRTPIDALASPNPSLRTEDKLKGKLMNTLGEKGDDHKSKEGSSVERNTNHQKERVTLPQRQPRGFSMPRLTAQQPEDTRLDQIPEVEENHQMQMESRLSQLIHQTLSVRIDYPPGVKYNQKMEAGPNDKYSGSGKFADLENWLSLLCHKYAVRQLGGADLDRIRCMTVVEYLEGDAKQWYLHHVSSVRRAKMHWTFEEVILGLYERFVHPSTMQDAREQFRNTKYSKEKGAQGFYDRLLECTQNMSVYPDEYTICDTFVWGLPEKMRYAATLDMDALKRDMAIPTELWVPPEQERHAPYGRAGDEKVGIPLPPRRDLLQVDQLARYALLHGRPGSPSPMMGVCIDRMLRVDRRTVFGAGLLKLLSPVRREYRPAFAREFGCLMAQPHAYHQAVDQYNKDHPGDPFMPQFGPTFSISRFVPKSKYVANMHRDDVMQLLIENRIPPEWIDHAYAFGVHYLNQRFNGSPIDEDLLASADNERLSRLDVFGEPAAIDEWSGWWNPSEDDIQRVQIILHQEEHSVPPIVSMDHYAWLPVGANLIPRYLHHRPPSKINAWDLPTITQVTNESASNSKEPSTSSNANVTLDEDTQMDDNQTTTENENGGGDISDLTPDDGNTNAQRSVDDAGDVVM